MSMASLYRRSLTSPPAIDFASAEGKVRPCSQVFRSMDSDEGSSGVFNILVLSFATC